MKELIVLKAQFIDPLSQTLRKMQQCINEDIETEQQSDQYMVEYQVIMDCVYQGINCSYVCGEFIIGSPSNLFLGKIEYYKEINYLIN